MTAVHCGLLPPPVKSGGAEGSINREAGFEPRTSTPPQGGQFGIDRQVPIRYFRPDQGVAQSGGYIDFRTYQSALNWIPNK